MSKIKRVCVFMGASSGKNPNFIKAAKEFGFLLASNRLELVYGGGRTGLMGAVADAALSGNGKVTGVIPHVLMTKEVAHKEVTELIVVESMHERKLKMSDLADAFVTLPGGFGTLEEIFEVITWMQLGIHQKPCGFLNLEGFYDPLLEFIQNAVEIGFIKKDYKESLLLAKTPSEMVDRLLNWTYKPIAPQWITNKSQI